MTPSPVTLFGGAGFVGRYAVKRLADAGARLVVPGRDPGKALFLKPMGDVGQIALVQANIRDDASVAAAVEGAEAVVNLVGVLFSRGRQSFAAVHAQGAERIAKAARAAGVSRLVHVSAIGAAAASRADYARSKAAGEAAVRAAFPDATIIRPGIVFGPEDDFFNRFAALARLSPVLPLIGGGETRFQPVYVGDAAEAIARILDRPETAGRTFELGGPRVYTFRELMEIVLRQTGRKCLLVPVPAAIASFKAWFLEALPKPPLTRDQVRMLADDNVVGGSGESDIGTFKALGIEPTPIETVLPTYMARYRRDGGRPASRFA